MASTAVAWFLPAGFVAIGSAMVAFSVRGRRARARWEEAATRTEGEVTDLRWRTVGPRGDRSMLAFPVIRFSLPDGRTVETQSNFGTNPPQAKQGERVTVLYEPSDPTKASLPAGGTAALVHYALIILGGLFVFIGLSAAVVLAMVL